MYCEALNGDRVRAVGPRPLGQAGGRRITPEVEGPEIKGSGSELPLRKSRGWDGMEFPEVQVEGA